MLFCLLVEVGDGDTGSEDGIVWVCDRHVRGSLGSLGHRLLACRVGKRGSGSSKRAYQIIELRCCDATIDTRDDFLGDGHRVDVVDVEAVTQARDAGCDLVELNALLAPIGAESALQAHLFAIKPIHTALPDEHGVGCGGLT